MRWLIVVSVVVVTGCRTSPDARLVRWSDDTGTASFTAPLCQMCTTPNAAQVDSMQSAASQRCPTGFRVVEEGTHLSPDVQAYALPMPGGGAVAGTQSFVDYYWVVRCNDHSAENIGDDLARFDHRFVVATLRDGSSVAGEVVARTMSTIKLRQVDGSIVEVARGDVASIKLRA